MRPYQFVSNKPVRRISKIVLFLFLLIPAAAIWGNRTCRANESAASPQYRILSYRLDASDFKELAKNAGLIDKVRALQEQTYANKVELEKAVQAIVDEAPAKYKTVLTPLAEKPDKATVYQFNDQSLVQLEANSLPEEIIANVKEQSAQTYADSQELNEAVDKMLMSPYKTLLALIVKSAEKSAYRLSDKFMELIGQADLSPSVEADLEHLNGQGVDDKKKLLEAAAGIIKIDATSTEKLHNGYSSGDSLQIEVPGGKQAPQTVSGETVAGQPSQAVSGAAAKALKDLRKGGDEGSKYVEEMKTYVLTRHSWSELKKNKVPAPIIHRLKKLKITGVTYIDKQVFVEEVKPVLEKEHAADMRYRSLIYASAGKQVTYRARRASVDNAIDELSKGQIPDDILAKTASLQGIDYPNQAVFLSALNVTLSNQYRAAIMAPIRKQKPYILTRQAFEALQKTDIAQQILAPLETLIASEFQSEGAFAGEVNKLVGLALRPYVPLIVQQALKEHVLAEGQFEPTIVQGGACDCFRDDFSRLTYGFYPFWEMEKQPAEGQRPKIDFSVLARIGLYAFPVAENGEMQPNLQWLKQTTAFFKTAHRYRTQVDLVVYNARWEQWAQSAEDRAERAIDTFAVNVVKILQPGSSKTVDWFQNRIGNRKTVSFDGLTIDFNGLKPEHWRDGVRLIEAIRRNLQATGRNYHLNLIIPGQGLDAIVDGLWRLRDLVPKDETQIGPVNYFIVFLESPITITKKELRRKIEEKFKGIERRNVVRRIIPVISPGSPADGDLGQLSDDLIYFEDNYGGVGFWPIPAFTDDSRPELDTKLREVFERGYSERSSLAELGTAVCKIICPNRWLVRIVWDVFFLMAVLCLLLYYGVCSLRPMINKYFLVVIAAIVLPFILIGLGLLFCDPYYSKISQGNTLLLFVIFGIIVYAVVSYRLKRKKADLP